VAAELVARLMNEPHPMGDKIILNVNVPDVPYAQLAGFKSTR
jgi:5'-nucleotidase